ncbi:MAG: hypothetical protein KBC48_02800 [Candidatus Pacebacteria bacterium]|nr:hypothetical protein [Candidatus Paceibacterota bacterium]
MVPLYDNYKLLDRVRIFVFLILQRETSEELKKIFLEDIKRSLPRTEKGERIGKVEVDEEIGRYTFHYSVYVGEDAAGDDHGYGELVVVERIPPPPGITRATSYQIWHESYQYSYSGENGARFCRSVDELIERTEPVQMVSGWGLKILKNGTPVFV